MTKETSALSGCNVLPPERSGLAPVAATAKPRKEKWTANRFACLNAFADVGARLVSTTAQACWWIIFRETKPDGLARISHRRIAECIGKGRHTVLRAIKELKRMGLLIVARRGTLHGGASTYRIRPVPQQGVAPMQLGV